MDIREKVSRYGEDTLRAVAARFHVVVPDGTSREELVDILCRENPGLLRDLLGRATLLDLQPTLRKVDEFHGLLDTNIERSVSRHVGTLRSVVLVCTAVLGVAIGVASFLGVGRLSDLSAANARSEVVDELQQATIVGAVSEDIARFCYTCWDDEELSNTVADCERRLSLLANLDDSTCPDAETRAALRLMRDLVRTLRQTHGYVTTMAPIPASRGRNLQLLIDAWTRLEFADESPPAKYALLYRVAAALKRTYLAHAAICGTRDRPDDMSALLDRAQQLLEEARKECPDLARAHNSLAWVQMARVDDAWTKVPKTELLGLIEKAEPSVGAAESYARTGRTKAVLANNRATLLAKKALVLHDLGRNDEATKRLRDGDKAVDDGLAAAPGHPFLHLTRAELLCVRWVVVGKSEPAVADEVVQYVRRAQESGLLARGVWSTSDAFLKENRAFALLDPQVRDRVLRELGY